MDMVCTCRLEGLEAALAARILAVRRLGCRPEELGVKVLEALGPDVRVDSDQWYGISAKGEYVECDHPLDGYVAIWLKLNDRLPAPDTHPELPGVVARQLVAYDKTKKAYLQHGMDCAVCGQRAVGNNCPEMVRLMDEWADADRACDEGWGAPPYDEEDEYSRRWWGITEDEE